MARAGRARPAPASPDAHLADAHPADAHLADAPPAASPARGGPGRVLVVACGALAREIGDVARANGWDHLDLVCLPAIWHNHPERIAPGVRAAIKTHRDNHAASFIAYADCGTGGALARLASEIGAEMLPGAHCYAVFQGPAAPPESADMRAFYLTDFLVRQFDAFVWRPLGLDRHPELRDAYFGAYERLVHLAQGDDPALVALARAHAVRLGLAFEHRPTGLGGLGAALAPAAPRP